MHIAKNILMPFATTAHSESQKFITCIDFIVENK